MNFKVGDKVIIKNNLVVGRMYGSESFTTDMQPTSGNAECIENGTKPKFTRRRTAKSLS